MLLVHEYAQLQSVDVRYERQQALKRQRLEVKTGSGFFRRPNKSSTTIDWPKQIDRQERGAKVSSASFGEISSVSGSIAKIFL